MRRPLLALAILGLALTAVGCGGGGGDQGAQTVLQVPSDATRDGYVSSSGFVNLTEGELFVGDTSQNTTYRGFVSFDLSGLPAGAEVVTATLRGVHVTSFGAAYQKLGTLQVDHIRIGVTLGPSDFEGSGSTLATDIGTLSVDATNGDRLLDVSEAVRADLEAGRGLSEFRLRFTTDLVSDGQADLAGLGSADHADTAVRPTLILTLTVP